MGDARDSSLKGGPMTMVQLYYQLKQKLHGMPESNDFEKGQKAANEELYHLIRQEVEEELLRLKEEMDLVDETNKE